MASRGGLWRFREQWKAGTPSRAATQWAQIKGYADANGLTERGKWWLALGDAPRRPTPLSRDHAVRKAGGSRAWQALQSRLLFPRSPLVRGSAGRSVPPEGSAQRGNGSGAGLRKSRPDSTGRRVDAFRQWAAGQVRSGARVDSQVNYAALRKINAERMRAVYGA